MNDLHEPHWPSLQPCMSITPCSAAARRMFLSSSASISMPTGSNRTRCFSPMVACLSTSEGRGEGGARGPPPSEPRSGLSRGRPAGRALPVVVGLERGPLVGGHLVQQHVRALHLGHPAKVVQCPHLLRVQ